MKTRIPDDKQFLFLGGVHRSGTSLLNRTLGRHPDISAFSGTGKPEDEGQHLQSVYPPDYAHGSPGRFGFHPDSMMNEHHPLATHANAEHIYSEWAQYWETGKPVLMEKSPPNIIRTRFLQHLFPDSMFLMILRHPVTVAYATLKWCPVDLPALIEHTLGCYERLAEDRLFLYNILVLRYEDMLRNPQRLFREIEKFCGIRAFPQQIDVDESRNSVYVQRWRQDLDRLGSRQSILLRAYHELFAERLAAFGYMLDDLDNAADIPWIYSPGGYRPAEHTF